MRATICMLVLCILLGCTPPAPVAVPTGSGTESLGAYEVHVMEVSSSGLRSSGANVQLALSKWLTAHPDLKVVAFDYTGDGNMVILAFRDNRGAKAETR